MKCIRIAAIAAVLVSAFAFTGCEKKEPTLAEKLEQATKDLDKAADQAVKDLDKAMEGLK